MDIFKNIFHWLVSAFGGGSKSSAVVTNNIIVNGASASSENTRDSTVAQEMHCDIEYMKTHTDILFIDNEKFQIVKTIKEAGWKNTHWLNGATLKNTDNERIVAADIIFVDIVGVAPTLFRDEGLGLIVSLKEKYPRKIVILYSSQGSHDIHHRAFDMIDDKMRKESRAGIFLNKIDKYAKKVCYSK